MLNIQKPRAPVLEFETWNLPAKEQVTITTKNNFKNKILCLKFNLLIHQKSGKPVK